MHATIVCFLTFSECSLGQREEWIRYRSRSLESCNIQDSWLYWKMSDVRHQLHLTWGFAFTLIATVNKYCHALQRIISLPISLAVATARHYVQMETMRIQCCTSSLIHQLLSILIFTAVQFQSHPCQNPDDWPTMDLFLLLSDLTLRQNAINKRG